MTSILFRWVGKKQQLVSLVVGHILMASQPINQPTPPQRPRTLPEIEVQQGLKGSQLVESHLLMIAFFFRVTSRDGILSSPWLC